MDRQSLPLNALRAFETAARHLSFTRAAEELCVTQAAVSHQVKSLEILLKAPLFRRLPRGLALTDEALALLPCVTESFDRIAGTLNRFQGGQPREHLTLGVVGTYAIGWLLPRLPKFREAHPFVDLRLATNNNRVDLAAEGLDGAIRFGDGAWHGTEAIPLQEAPLSPLCAPEAAKRLTEPRALQHENLLRSYRTAEWPDWFAAAGLAPPPVAGPIFDTSGAMVEAAMLGLGVALAPPAMFQRHLDSGRLRQPFSVSISRGRYWLTWLKSKPPAPAMKIFQAWIETTLLEGV
jgi:LysR family transcriptional regulator of beta-lactamase